MTPTQSNDPVVRLQNIRVRYGGVTALSDVSFDIRAGVHGIVGANGAGKTTAVNVVTGLVRPSRGKVSFLGKDVTAMSMHRRARQGILRTFQTPQLFDQMTGWELLDLSDRAPRASHRPQPDRAIRHEIIERLRLTEWVGRPIHQYPYGVRRRVEIARALQGRPTVLVMDEPSSGLDIADVENVRLAIEAARAADTSVCLIDHSIALIRGVCTSLTALKSGAVIADGDPESVLADKEVVASYVGTDW